MHKNISKMSVSQKFIVIITTYNFSTLSSVKKFVANKDGLPIQNYLVRNITS